MGEKRGANDPRFCPLGQRKKRAAFKDPDGNSWLLQEVTTRFPGRVDSNETKFASVADLASAMRRAETAHGEYEKRALAGVRDANWSDWYAEYIAAEQSGRELPQ